MLRVRLTPKASRDGVDGIGALADGRPVAFARVRAPPADGAANAALTKLIARAFPVRKSAVTIVSGHTSRLKQVRIEGDPDALSAVIATWPSIA